MAQRLARLAVGAPLSGIGVHARRTLVLRGIDAIDGAIRARSAQPIRWIQGGSTSSERTRVRP